MYVIIYMNFILFLLSSFIVFINIFISKKMYKMRMKVTSFECGFDSVSMLRLPFSVQFYLISIIFLIFDVEISLILLLIISYKIFLFEFSYIFIFIMYVLIMGLYYEYKEGSLNWLK